MLASLIALLALGSDSIALTHVDLASKTDAMFLTVHAEQSVPLDALSPVKSSFNQFFQAAGKQPVEFVCAADVDGDGMDEIAVVRANATTGKATLRIMNPPSKAGMKKPKILASFIAGLPAASGDGALVAMGRIDIDNDARDELALVRSFLDGHHEILIVAPPTKKNLALGPEKAHVTVAADGFAIRNAFGISLTPGILALESVDSTGSVRLTTHTIPSFGSFVLPSPVSTVSLDLANTVVEAVAPQGESGQTPGGFVVLRRMGPAVQRIELAGDAGQVVTSETMVTGAVPIRHCLAIGNDEPPPPPVIVASFTIGTAWGGGDVIHVSVMGAGSVVATANANGWTIPLPNAPATFLQLGTNGALSPSVFSISFTDGGISYRADMNIPGGLLFPWQTPQRTTFGLEFLNGSNSVGILNNLTEGVSWPLQIFSIQLIQ